MDPRFAFLNLSRPTFQARHTSISKVFSWFCLLKNLHLCTTSLQPLSSSRLILALHTFTLRRIFQAGLSSISKIFPSLHLAGRCSPPVPRRHLLCSPAASLCCPPNPLWRSRWLNKDADPDSPRLISVRQNEWPAIKSELLRDL